jgi:lysophospholipase L1-like esterase
MRRRIVALTVLAALSVAGYAGSAQADDNYIALGDSYSSGVGTRAYYNETCKRSYWAYPHLLAATWPHPADPPRPKATGVTLHNHTCGGATVADVTSKQLQYVPADATYVTISVGGNDAGFGDVIKQCAKPEPFTCGGDIDKAQDYIRNTLPNRLYNLFTAIRRRAPFAHVIVVGYPRLFGPQECNGAARISIGEQKRLNRTADMLRDVDLWEATAAGRAFYYLDPRMAFIGHAICSGSNEWLNGLSNPTSESFHPNRNGQHAYFQLIYWNMAVNGW